MDWRTAIGTGLVLALIAGVYMGLMDAADDARLAAAAAQAVEVQK